MSNQAWDEQLQDLHRAQRRIRVAPAVHQPPPAKPAPTGNLNKAFAAGLAKVIKMAVHRERSRAEAEAAELRKRIAELELAAISVATVQARLDAVEGRMRLSEQTIRVLYNEAVNRAAEQAA